MQTKRHNIIIGLFVFAAIATAAYLIIKFGGTKRAGNYYEITVNFNTAAALMHDAPVFYAGVECGKVHRILPVSDETRKVRVILRIKEDTPIRRKDIITISSLSLLGDKIVKITPGEPSEPVLPPYSQIEGVDSVEIQDLITPELQANINSAIRGLADLVNEENRVLFSKTIKNLYLASVGLSDDIENLRQVLNEDTRNSIRKIIENVEKASNNLPVLIEQMASFLSENTNNVEELIASLTRSSYGISKFVSSLQSLVREISSPEGTIGRLIHSSELYDNLNALIEGIKLYGLLGFQNILQQKELEERKTREIWNY